MLDLSTPQKLPSLEHTKKLGNIQFSGFLKSHPQTAHTLFSIEKYLQNHPPFFLNSLLSSWKGLSLDQIKPMLQEQYKALLQGRSFLHVMNNGIQSRKRCLNKIRRDITKSRKFLALFPQQYYEQTEQDAAYIDWVEVEGYSVVDVDQSVEESIKAISNIFADMFRLRQMTIYLVQQIHKWRIKIEEHLDRCQQHSDIKYLFEDKDVYESFLEDTTFIWNSKLSNYIWMEAKQDPFIIRNVILVQQRKRKTMLQKYFLQIVYPKNEQTVDRSIKCFEMLAYRYKPKLFNRFEEEELLIENYLKMEMNQHQFDQPQDGLHISRTSRKSPQSIEKSRGPQEQNNSPQKKNRLTQRGWVFEKKLTKTHRERINDIVQTHKNKMGNIKTFNIANYGQKNSIALAYLTETKKDSRKIKFDRIRKHSIKSEQQDRHVMSQGQERRKQNAYQRGVQSQPEKRGMSDSKMFRSLTKLHPIIYEDPKEELPDTPKAGDKKQSRIASDTRAYNTFSHGKQPSLQHIKINSFAQEEFRQDEARIQIEQEETPLNLNQFYQVFRADTNKPRKANKDIEFGKSKVESRVVQNEKLVKIKTFLDRVRKQRGERAKSMQHLPNTPYTKRPIKFTMKKKYQRSRSKSKSLQKSAEKSIDSLKEFNKVSVQPKINLPKDHNQIKKVFLALKVKSIPIDLVPAYVKHLQSKRPVKSRIFSDFDTKALTIKLSDPFIHSIIFDITTDDNTLVGTIVLSETLGGRGGKLKYCMEFMSVQPFELVSVAMLRVAEELLSTTPCQQVVFPLIVDKLDLVSSQFIDIIDSDLVEGIQKFGRLVILEKPRLSLRGTDVRERMYVFTSESNSRREKDRKLKMMGNYRSLKFECKCIVLTSNFRLRSDNLVKNTLHKYQKQAIGQLFARAIMRFMTKYHLKQLKQASFGGQGQLGNLVRTDPFLRSILAATANDMKTNSEDILKTTNFATMEDILNYLRYKRHDEHFQFQFLAESKFILKHELTLIELDEELSLQFTLTSNQQLYILNNHKQHQLTQLNCGKFSTSAYLLPTTHEQIQLFLMSAEHYSIETTDRIDLFTYLSLFFRHIESEVFLNDIPSVITPNLHQQHRKIFKVRMFDGFFRLFPEREFYSAARIDCTNLWESYYPDAVTHQPLEKSIVMDYPFVIGMYDKEHKTMLSAFLYSSQDSTSP